MKNKKLNQQERIFKLMELNKTPERKKFESEHTCYIFSLRPNSAFDPDQKELKWIIDSWINIKPKDYIETSRNYNIISLRARFNNATVYGVWLPNEFNDNGTDKIKDPDKFYNLIWKYKFKL